MKSESKCNYEKMGTAWLCVYCEMEKLTECVNATEKVKNYVSSLGYLIINRF